MTVTQLISKAVLATVLLVVSGCSGSKAEKPMQGLVPAALHRDHNELIGIMWNVHELNGSPLYQADNWLGEPKYTYFRMYMDRDGKAVLEGYGRCNMFSGEVYQARDEPSHLQTPHITIAPGVSCSNANLQKQEQILQDIFSTKDIWQSAKIYSRHTLTLGPEDNIRLKATMLLGAP